MFALDAYGYTLPETSIAQHPAAKRDRSRLMVVHRRAQMICHDHFANIGEYLPAHTLFVLNNSKVIPARLLGRKKRSGGRVEVFLLKAAAGGDGQTFETLLKPRSRIKVGDTVDFAPGLEAVILDKDRSLVRFNQKQVLKFLQKAGHVPLPPYIHREDSVSDRRNYQTVYAKHPGSVAAPTAGLHFTKPLMAKLRAQGHAFQELTLHVNYGTFKPVVCPDIREHEMHSERYRVDAAVHRHILKARSKARTIAAVGTTSCRVLESLTASGKLESDTDIFIYPGHRFKAVDILLTNFHLPHSTLLMLVCAFGGYEFIMRAYREAIKHGYRFYSYGDAMLII